jgi:alpha-L-arabinofuranosidase
LKRKFVRISHHGGGIPHFDIAAKMDGKTLSLFILNLDLAKQCELEIVWREKPPERVAFSQVLTGNDLKAFNSFEDPKKVAPQGYRWDKLPESSRPNATWISDKTY